MEDLFKQVLSYMKKGYGRCVIQRELGLSQKKVQNMIKAVRAKYPDLKPTNQGKKSLHLMEDVSATKEKRITRAQALEQKLSETDDTYELCKALSTSPAGLKRMMDIRDDVYNPVGKILKKLVLKGCKYSDIKREFGERISFSRAKEIILDNYPNHFLIETKLPDGDVRFTPVPESKINTEWLTGTLDRDFQYYISPEENYMTVKFREDLLGDDIVIYNITDIHVGSKAFRKDVLVSIIDNIKNDPMAFFTIGGDLIEAITKQSVGYELDQYAGLNEQAVEAVKLFKPIAHKCIAYCVGNHDKGRTWKPIHFDLGRMMAQMLGVPYFDRRVVIDLVYKDVIKTISLTHKYGNAIAQSQVIKEVEKLSTGLGYKIHCFFSGHNHISFIQAIEYTNKIIGEGFVQETCWVANGGSFVKYTGTYAEEAGYKMAPQNLVYFTFNSWGGHSAGSISIPSI